MASDRVLVMVRAIRKNSGVRSIQKLTVTSTGGQSISEVIPGKTMLYCITRAGAYVAGPGNIGQGSLAAHLTDSTTVTTYSNGSVSGTAGDGTIYINVVEYE